MIDNNFNKDLLKIQPQLESFARMLTNNNVEEAKDLVQDTYLKALSNRDKFIENSNLKAWAFTIMKNTFINNFRRLKKNNTIVDKTDDLYFLNLTKTSENPTPDSELFTKEILQSINTLDVDQRRPFEMHNEGYKYKEIADQLNISIGTVKSRIFFTRQKLMNDLKDYVD